MKSTVTNFPAKTNYTRALTCLIGLCLAGNLSAAVIEEVIVTAQKREESLSDVPVSVAAFVGEHIRSRELNNLEQLSLSVPNFTFSNAVGGSDNFYMRGIGSGENYGNEMAVGQVIDAVFYGRSRFGRLAFLDVERVEVLRGPQGAIIGKNTSAGAINIVTAGPTDTFEAWGTGSWEFDGNEGYTIEGAISGRSRPSPMCSRCAGIQNSVVCWSVRSDGGERFCGSPASSSPRCFNIFSITPGSSIAAMIYRAAFRIAATFIALLNFC
jgi:outer membrane receptor protein involved in Fe transport